MGFVPERLKDIRIKHGHTTEDLARQCNKTKQAISKYETGQATPSEDVLKKIVEVYSLSAGYLTKENILPEEKSAVFYRRTKRTPDRVFENVQINLKWLYEIIVAAGELYPLPLATLSFLEDYSSAEEKAQVLREAWGLGMEPIDDLGAVIEQHGFYLFTAKMEEAKVDGYSQLIGGYPIIILNQDRGSIARKCFSLAHEVAHLVMHAREKFDGNQQKEEQADEFAGCFLMPEAALRRDMQDIIRINAETMKMLGEKWHVSPQAVVERCFMLNLLGKNTEESKAHRQSLLQKLNRKADYVPQEVRFCSLENVLRRIDSDEEMREKFLGKVCLPIYEIQNVCQLSSIFEKGTEQAENVEDMDGIQLSLPLER